MPRTSQSDYLSFQLADDYCQSNIGRIGGEQRISCDIGDGFGIGSLVHEIGHTVGLYHEHQRPDRDLYVEIHTDNIASDKERHFAIKPSGTISGDYDYGSIMHYGRKAFAQDRNKDTITPKQNVSIGQRDGLSPIDIAGVCAMYDAPHFAVAWQHDQHRTHAYQVRVAGLARWGKYCFGPKTVNSSANTLHASPVIKMDKDRGTVVLWEEFIDGTESADILASAFDFGGKELFKALRINTSSGTKNQAPDMAMDDDDGFVAVWQERNGSGQKILARGYNKGAIVSFNPITVCAGTADIIPAVPAVGVDGAKNFAVAWGELNNDSLSVKVKGFNRLGNERFQEILVADELGDQDVWPRIAVARTGEFTVAWEDRLQDVYIKGFNNDGTVRFPEKTVSQYVDGRQLLSDIAMTPTGEIFVVWTDDRNKNKMWQIRAAVISADGQNTIKELTINPRGGGDQLRPKIAITSSGDYYVVWDDDEDKNDVYQVHAQGNDANHQAVVSSLTINKIWEGQQLKASVATR